MATKNQYTEIALGKLKSSGLTDNDASLLNIEEFKDASVISKEYDKRPVLRFTYSDIFGKKCPPTDFHRIRYLTAPGGFAGKTKWQRYAQPSGSLNWVYVPQNFKEWELVARVVATPIYITEGELKAACACAYGLPTLGLGGVDVFQSRKRGIDALHPLSQIEWKGRAVIIVFDTDGEGGLKEEVARAAERLMSWLTQKGAIPSLAILPFVNGKVGIDDYLVEFGVEKFRDEVLARNTIEYTAARALMEAAEKYDYLRPHDRFIILNEESSRLKLYSLDHFDRTTATERITMPVLKPVRSRGSGFVMANVPESQPVSKALLGWAGFQQSADIVYKPGLPRRVVDEATGQKYTNLWRGWHCEYDEKTLPSEALRSKVMSEWFWTLDNIFGDDPVARAYIEDWIFYPMKYPGTKMNTFALVIAKDQGIGKSFIGHMLAKHVYGMTPPGACHAWLLREGDLAAAFNPYLFATSFVVGDEIASSDKRSSYERLKANVTENTAVINLKNQPQIQIENCANFYISSNDMASLDVKKEDRRAFVHSPRNAKKNDERYYALDKLFNQGIGGRVLLHHAREVWKQQKDFNPRNDAPKTEAREELIITTQSGMTTWAVDLVDAVDDLTRSIATPQELLALFEKENLGQQGKHTVDSLGRALAAAGMIRPFGGTQIYVRESDHLVRRRVWSIGNHTANKKLSKAAAVALLETPFAIRSKVVHMPEQKAKRAKTAK